MFSRIGRARAGVRRHEESGAPTRFSGVNQPLRAGETRLDSGHSSTERGRPADWRSQAFGLAIRGEYPAMGFPSTRPADLPVVRASTISRREARDRWSTGESERLVNWRFDDGRPVMTIDRHPVLGYRLFGVRSGVHIVSADGSHIRSVPPHGSDWTWQRFLVGQVLPLAAMLNGYEVLHASAVTVGGQAVAFLGESGMGKSSLALNLVLRNATLLTDDVASIAVRNGIPTVHPGPRLANLRNEEAAKMGSRQARLGNAIGGDEESVRLLLRGSARPAPLRALYFLERTEAVPALRFDEITGAGFCSVVAGAFTRFVSTPSRMRNQLDVYGAIVERAPLFRLRVPLSMSAAELSRHVKGHICDALL